MIGHTNKQTNIDYHIMYLDEYIFYKLQDIKTKSPNKYPLKIIKVVLLKFLKKLPFKNNRKIAPKQQNHIFL